VSNKTEEKWDGEY